MWKVGQCISDTASNDYWSQIYLCFNGKSHFKTLDIYRMANR